MTMTSNILGFWRRHVFLEDIICLYWANLMNSHILHNTWVTALD